MKPVPEPHSTPFAAKAPPGSLEAERDELRRFADTVRQECGEFQIIANVMSELRRLQREALRHKGIINVLADKLGRYTGKPVPEEIRLARNVCIEEQAYADLAASGGIVDAP